MSRSRKKRTATKRELRGAMSAGLIVTRYTPDGERAEIRQLSPGGPERRQSFARRLTNDTAASEEG